ncbi:sensor histidine kinase [Pedobacter psychroterrae]|uniref:histidine kinase n=1 Tax=Pedobacter psychroterrae TaxID=2530453 RepID=A0A4R0NJY3_9SPHI|nr:HAMP domain-containing sensor histidine kinase [Pedobacter psychroterrae]TCD01011.1 HAMP domain-containing histidine kinase [Pedobacter psychroterrae]
MLNLLKYKTPEKYSSDFKEAYSYINVKQIKILSSAIFALAATLRIFSVVFYKEMGSLPNFAEYNISNMIQITAGPIFIIVSTIAAKPNSWTVRQRNILTLIFSMFLLSITFYISFIYSQHNTKNTMTVFLIGIVMVSIFFSLEFKYILILSLHAILLFIIGMIIPNLDLDQKILNTGAAIILAFVLYICSRYSYFFKSQHFTQLRQLEEKNIEVQELNRQKSEILGFVAHDLRNPLNNIEALSRIILEENKGTENTEAALILSSSRQAKDIINDLIEVVQEEKIPFQMVNINMVDYLSGICMSWQANSEEQRKINFIAHESELLSSVNPSKFNRVIDNLIGNGLKFSETNTPIDVEVLKKDTLCMIRVKDYGIGIPDNLKTLLFDQFSKAGRQGLKGERSIGLGLHISKDIVEQHGGTLSLESEENKGSTFIISMPLAG